jgi:hypothetical protein
VSALEWKITGLPLHPLVVHAAVVFTPLASLAALAYVFVARYRDLLRWPTLVLAVVAAGAIWAAYLTGNNFFDSDHFKNFSGELLDRIEKHESYARTLRWIATGFGIVTVAAAYLHDRQGTRRRFSVRSSRSSPCSPSSGWCSPATLGRARSGARPRSARTLPAR